VPPPMTPTASASAVRPVKEGRDMRVRSRGVRCLVLGAATMLLAIANIAPRFDPLPEGLTATYFSDTSWSSPPLNSTIDPRPSTESLLNAWRGNPPQAFSARWAGSFVALRGGTYFFATASDDGSWVYVDGRLVVDNGGRHRRHLAAASVVLNRGVHSVLVEYFNDGGAFNFELSWARGDAPLESVPAWALFPRRAPISRMLVSLLVRRSLPFFAWLWLGTLLFVTAISFLEPLERAAERAVKVLKENRVILALTCVVAASLVLNLAGISWGLPSMWAGDEITPPEVLIALSQRFSNGWFERYPPFHFYVLSAVLSPWLLLQSLPWFHISDLAELTGLLVVSRLVSVAAATGTLIAIYLSGASVFGRRAGLFAAAIMGLLSPFVYYSKTANPEMPYVFWFAVSLVFYLRLLRSLALKDFLLFASAASLAICTKDQAYALYLSAPFVIIYHLWQANREVRRSHPLARAFVDPRPWLAGIAAAALFMAVHNVLFNSRGFIEHVHDITGPGIHGYEMVEPTTAGRLALLRLTAGLNQESWGWPLWLVTLIGIAVAAKKKESRCVAICLVLVIVLYYIGFINVIRYCYDRYLIPVCVVEALFGGLALDQFLQSSHRPAWTFRAAVVVGVFAYTLLYAATVDVLMLRDSRYVAERWLRAHAGPDRLVGTVFLRIVLPRLDGLQSADIGTIDDLRREAPAYFVLNADYARAVRAATPLGRLLGGLQDQNVGYRLAFRYRSPPPWPWLPAPHRDLVGPRLETPDTPVLSFLRDINPTIEIYQAD
jgi:fibro-slime domain-containing protein